MSRVEIHSADGRKVIVEHDGPLGETQVVAHTTWDLTVGGTPPARPGPGTGFQAAADRRYSPPVQPSAMRRSPGPWPIQSEATGEVTT